MTVEAFKIIADMIIYKPIFDQYLEENKLFKYIFDTPQSLLYYLSLFIYPSKYIHCVIPRPPTLKCISHEPTLLYHFLEAEEKKHLLNVW